jgi:hypothetical protein
MKVIDRTSTQTVPFLVQQLIPSQVEDFTSDEVAFALTIGRMQRPARQRPTDESWVDGYWITVPGGDLAAIDIGPTGALTPAVGVYTIWIRISDDPDTYIAQLDTIQIT